MQYTNNCRSASLSNTLNKFSMSPRMTSFRMRLIFNKLGRTLKLLINPITGKLCFFIRTQGVKRHFPLNSKLKASKELQIWKLNDVIVIYSNAT